MQHPLAGEPDRLVFAGDWHGDIAHAKSVIWLADAQDANGVIQLGDFGIWPGREGQRYLDGVDQMLRKTARWLLFIDGNHEDFTQLTGPVDDYGARPIRERIWHLPRGLRWTWWGQTWLALGGGTSLDRPKRRIGLDWWPEEAITRQEAEVAMNGGFADVMLTHDCPVGTDIPGLPPASVWNPEELVRAQMHRRVLREVVDEVRPARLWHGHFHSRYDGRLEGDGYVTKVTGLGDNTGPIRKSYQVVDLPGGVGGRG